MSALLTGRRTTPAAAPESLHRQAEALEAAVEAGGEQLDTDAVGTARRTIAKVGERSALAGNHTVVALAGATGSGKSSLFNALAGDRLAEVGARRPTTARPTAAVWGDEPAGPLLDWLGVRQRHGVPVVPGEDGAGGAGGADAADGADGAGGADGGADALDGLVLLDLPDFDSREASHRAEAERILALCDVFVWVTDPQKYADALLHEDYLRRLAGHAGVMLVVLNQADRLTAAAVDQCRADLDRLVTADGAAGVDILATSVVTGEGVAELRRRVADAVAGHEAARRRLAADLTAVATQLRRGVADHEADLDVAADDRLVDALSRAAGVPAVLDAVQEDYRREAHARAGWVFTRWGRRLRPDPLRRLRLDRAPSPYLTTVDELDVRHVVGRSSIPAPSAAARSAVKLAGLQLTDRAATGLPVLWAEAVSDAAAPTDDRLLQALDRVVVTTSLRGRTPVWWRVFGWLQWLLGLTTVVGLLWLVVLGVVGWLQLPQVDTPKVGAVPVPTLLFGGGLVLGLVAAWVARSLARVGARRRRNVVGDRLRRAVAQVAAERLVEPVRAVLDRHRLTRERLEVARRS